MSRPHFGIDERQRNARIAAGMHIPRVTEPKPREKSVGEIVLVLCEKCGCTYGKPANGKHSTCIFCGAKN